MKITSLSFSLFVFLMITLSCHCQSSKIQLGVEVGPSLSTLRLDPFFYPSKWSESGLGYTIGFELNCNIKEKFGFKLDLTFERISIDNIGGDPRDYWNYIVLPVMFKFKLGKARRFYYELGPFLGCALYSPSNSWKTFDFGLSTGFGYEIPIIKQLSFHSELYINYGLQDISAVKGYYSYYTCSTNLQFGVMYNFMKK